MSNSSEAPEKVVPGWMQSDRVTTTPTHYEIAVTQPFEESSDPIEKARDQTDGGLPDVVSVRRGMHWDDFFFVYQAVQHVSGGKG